MSDTEISLERVRMQLHELLKTSQVEEVSLPTIGGHLPAESMVRTGCAHSACNAAYCTVVFFVDMDPVVT